LEEWFEDAGADRSCWEFDLVGELFEFLFVSSFLEVFSLSLACREVWLYEVIVNDSAKSMIIIFFIIVSINYSENNLQNKCQIKNSRNF
jgi:hypothetical protein